MSVEDAWTTRNISYDFTVAPYGENRDIILVRSEKPDFVLPAGRYVVVLKGLGYDFMVAGPINDPAQCLEWLAAANGTFYYCECRKPQGAVFASLINSRHQNLADLSAEPRETEGGWACSVRMASRPAVSKKVGAWRSRSGVSIDRACNLPLTMYRHAANIAQIPHSRSMALTGRKTKCDGWRRQAEHLTLKHTAVATAMLAAAKQEHHQRASRDAEGTRGSETSKSDSTNEPMPPSMKYAELEKQVVRESAIAGNTRRETLAARAARVGADDKRIAELERELALAQEILFLRENENHSLKASLDLFASDNLNLSSRLRERDAAVDEAHRQLRQIKTTLVAAEADRSELTASIEKAKEKRKTEANTLNSRLAAMAERAVTMEKLLSEAQQSLVVCSEEKISVERKLADATAVRHAVDRRLELLEDSLQVKESEVRELEQNRSELIEGADTLLQTLKKRDTTLNSRRGEDQIVGRCSTYGRSRPRQTPNKNR